MQFLRSNTAVIVTVGPFYDKTDGVTIETALTITNERITLTADTDAGSAPTNILDNVTGATSGTSNDLNYITGNDAGLMQIELSAADVNRVGRMKLTITDAANHVPVWEDFFVFPQAIFDWLTGVIVPLPANVTQLLGTAWATPATAGLTDVNVKQLSTDATAADNAEAFFDGTGYAGTGNIIPTVTTVGTLTTYTGNTPQTGDSFARIGAAGAGLTNIDLPNQTMDITGNITGNLSGSVGSVTGAVGSVTAGVTLAASAVQAIWDALTSALTTVGSIGKKLADWTVGTIDTYTGNTKQTGDNFARLGAPAGASVSADIAAVNAKTTNLPASPASTTNITAGTITTVTNLTNAPTSGDLTATMKASVNTEVVDGLAVDTYAEPGQGAPAATTTLAAKINYLFKSWRNKKTQTSTTRSLYADDGTTVDQKATDSDDATTFTKGELGTGP